MRISPHPCLFVSTTIDHSSTRRYISLLLLALIWAFAGCQPLTQPTDDDNEVLVDDEVMIPADFDIQGHRGARGLSPESTLPSFETALDLGVTTLELDLHLSQDDELIVWHDPFIQADKCQVPEGLSLPDPALLAPDDPALMIRNLTSEELRQYRCDQNPDPSRFPDQHNGPTGLAGDDFGIITLAELFAFLDLYLASESKPFETRNKARQVRFNIETKRVPDHPEYIGDGFDGTAPGLFEETLIEVLQAHNLQDRANLQSFDHRSLWAAKSQAPWLRLAALDREVPATFALYAEAGVDTWSPRASLITAESLEAAHQADLNVTPWTVNDLSEMHRLIRLGVDGIITDRPDRLVSLRPSP